MGSSRATHGGGRQGQPTSAGERRPRRVRRYAVSSGREEVAAQAAVSVPSPQCTSTPGRGPSPSRRRPEHRWCTTHRRTGHGRAHGLVRLTGSRLTGERPLGGWVRSPLDRGELPPMRGFVGNAGDTHFGDFRHFVGLAPGLGIRGRLAHTGAFSEPETTITGRIACSTGKPAALCMRSDPARPASTRVSPPYVGRPLPASAGAPPRTDRPPPRSRRGRGSVLPGPC